MLSLRSTKKSSVVPRAHLYQAGPGLPSLEPSVVGGVLWVFGNCESSRKLPAPRALESIVLVVSTGYLTAWTRNGPRARVLLCLPWQFSRQPVLFRSICLVQEPVQKPGTTGWIFHRLCPTTGQAFHWFCSVLTEDSSREDNVSLSLLIGFESPAGPTPSPSAPPASPWQGRSVASSKLWMLEFSAFLERQQDPDTVGLPCLTVLPQERPS